MNKQAQHRNAADEQPETNPHAAATKPAYQRPTVQRLGSTAGMTEDKAALGVEGFSESCGS